MGETGLTLAVVGYQVRTHDAATAIGEVEGVRSRGIRVHRLRGRAGRRGYVPAEGVLRVDRATNTIFLREGIGVDQVAGAPPPPDEGAGDWHVSPDWWADLLGHYGLFAPEGRSSEPILHPDQR
jgi:hypothetical protein